MSEAVIKCESVYKIFGTNAAKMLKEANGSVDAKTFQENGCIVGVNNASFEVLKGEMLVVMGLSGSGKSTLLRCISRLTDATGGKIYIEGQDLLAMNDKQLIELRRSKMGMVFQSFALLPHKTVLENIAFPLQIKGGETDESIKKAAKREAFEEIGININTKNLLKIGVYKSINIHPKVIDKEFHHTYVLEVDDGLIDINHKNREVDDLKFISINEMENLIKKRNKKIFIGKNREYYQDVFEKVKSITSDNY